MAKGERERGLLQYKTHNWRAFSVLVSGLESKAHISLPSFSIPLSRTVHRSLRAPVGLLCLPLVLLLLALKQRKEWGVPGRRCGTAHTHMLCGSKEKRCSLCLLLRSLNYRRPLYCTRAAWVFITVLEVTLTFPSMLIIYATRGLRQLRGACLRSPLTREDRQWDLWKRGQSCGRGKGGERHAWLNLTVAAAAAPFIMVPALNSNFRYSTVSACIMHAA